MPQRDIIAYHGTTSTAAACIRTEQHFKESKKDCEWLGHGVYFYYYKQHAEAWLKKRHLENGVVLSAQLEYDDKEMLDLDDPSQRDALNREIQKVGERIGKEVKAKFNENPQWVRWCFACNLYRKLHPEIGITSYTFSLCHVKESGFRENERQLCVSRQEIIRNIN